MDNVTTETTFVGRSGNSVVIHRYGQDDYSAWVTDDTTKDWHGCSVRGTLVDIMEEVADELPDHKVMSNSRRLETIAQFVDIFDDFLDYKGVDIPNDERDQDPCASNIYGTDYGWVADRIETLLMQLNVL